MWLGIVREPVVDVSSGDRMYVSAGEVLEVKSKDLSLESLRNLEVVSTNISVQADQHAALNAHRKMMHREMRCFVSPHQDMFVIRS